MSTPVSRPRTQSKIPRPLQPNTVSKNVPKRTDGIIDTRSEMRSQKKGTRPVVIPKKACTEIKVQRRTDGTTKARSDMKLQKKETCHKNEPVCRRRILNDGQTKSNQKSDYNDISFEPNKQALESILNNQGIVPGGNFRESSIQNGKRSSVYYLPPPNQSSMLKSHMEFTQNMKALQEKLRQLNIVTPSMKQDAKLPSTPNQSSRPSNIYYKIKPLSVDKMTMSARKVLTSKNSEVNLQSAVKSESKNAGISSLFHQSTHGKENKLNSVSSASRKKLDPLLESSLPSSPSSKNANPLLERTLLSSASSQRLDPLVETTLPPSASSKTLHSMVETSLPPSASNKILHPLVETSLPPSASSKTLQPLVESSLPVSCVKGEKSCESSDKVNCYLNAVNVKSEPTFMSSHGHSHSLDPLRHGEVGHANAVRNSHESVSRQTHNNSNTNHISCPSSSKPLIPLSLLMTPTPPRSQVNQALYSSSFTPSSPKYSSVLSTNNLSTWTHQGIVSTPKYSQLSAGSYVERKDMPTRGNSHHDNQAIQSHWPVQNVHSSYTSSYPYHLSTPTRATVPTVATPQLTPRTPNLSSCLKTVGVSKSTCQANLRGNTASSAKKLRWADMSNS